MNLKSFLLGLFALCTISFTACDKDNDDNLNNPNTPVNPDDKVVPDLNVNDLSGLAWTYQGPQDANASDSDSSVAVFVSFFSPDSGTIFLSASAHNFLLPIECGTIDFSYSCSQGKGAISAMGSEIASFVVASNGKLFFSGSRLFFSATMAPVEFCPPSFIDINLSNSRWSLVPKAADLPDFPPFLSDFVISFPPLDTENGSLLLSVNGVPLAIPFSYHQLLSNPYENYAIARGHAILEPDAELPVVFDDILLLRMNNNLFISFKTLSSFIPGQEAEFHNISFPLSLVNID